MERITFDHEEKIQGQREAYAMYKQWSSDIIIQVCALFNLLLTLLLPASKSAKDEKETRGLYQYNFKDLKKNVRLTTHDDQYYARSNQH
jgi:hypothetical protein